MKFKNPEYLGLMYLHAARHAFAKRLAKGYSRERMLEPRTVLPYCIRLDDGLAVLNRSYKPMGTPPERGWVEYDECPQYRIPMDRCRVVPDIPKNDSLWLFNDSCTPWSSRENAEAYLERLDEWFDFSTDDLREVN